MKHAPGRPLLIPFDEEGLFKRSISVLFATLASHEPGGNRQSTDSDEGRMGRPGRILKTAPRSSGDSGSGEMGRKRVLDAWYLGRIVRAGRTHEARLARFGLVRFAEYDTPLTLGFARTR